MPLMHELRRQKWQTWSSDAHSQQLASSSQQHLRLPWASSLQFLMSLQEAGLIRHDAELHVMWSGVPGCSAKGNCQGG